MERVINSYNTYVVFLSDGKIVLEPLIGKPPKPFKCRDLLEKLELHLWRQGFIYVYTTKEDHEEKVMRRGGDEIIIIYSECVVKTNIPKERLEKLLRDAYTDLLATGIM